MPWQPCLTLVDSTKGGFEGFAGAWAPQIETAEYQSRKCCISESDVCSTFVLLHVCTCLWRYACVC
jgi:hypothetical protein